MEDMTSVLNKTQEVVGVLFGVVLFFSETIVVNGNEMTRAQYLGQIDQWLGAGLILFFLIFGHYLLYGKDRSRIEKSRDIIGMKSALIGFILWLLIAIITVLSKITIPYSLNIAGGHIIIISIYFLMRKKYM